MIWQNIDNLTPAQAAMLDAYLDGVGDALPQVYQVVKIFWPGGTVNYSFLPIADAPFAVDSRLRADDLTKPFLGIKRTAAIAPDSVQLRFNDRDKAIRTLMRDGENARAEVFLYFPTIDLLVSEFVGQVKRAKRQRWPITQIEIVAGVRPNLYPATTRMIFYTGCGAIYGGHLNTWEEISRNPCKVNNHIPILPDGVQRIGNLDPATGAPFASCPKSSRAVCQQVSGKPDMYFGGEEITDVTTVGGGSKSTLAKPFNVVGDLSVNLGVLFGYRQKIPLTLRHFVRQSPGSNNGSLVTIFWASEGPIQQLFNPTLRGKAPQGQVAFTGEWLQPTTPYVQTVMGQDIGNFSQTAYCLLVENPVNPATIKKEEMTAEASMLGYAAVRVFNADGTFVKTYTEISSWCLLEWLTSLQFGLALPDRDLVVADFIKLAAWDAEAVQAKTPTGETITATRNRFNQFIQGRKAEEVMKDWCLSMRYSLPFVHGGKLRIVALERWDLSGVPKYLVGDGQTTGGDVMALESGDFKGWPDIEPLFKSADELPLKLKITFDDDEKGVPGRPLLFEDAAAILKARRANQDVGWNAPEKQYNWYGVTNYAQAVRASNFTQHLGEFDTGGTRNNFGAKLVVNGVRSKTLNLHPAAVIELDWPEFADEREPGFEEPFRYFRIIEHYRRPDLKTELTVWAYPKRYYECYGGAASEAEAPLPTAGADGTVLLDELV